MSFLSTLAMFILPPGPLCQSCSMPMKQDPGHGGTERDGTHSTLYCSYCYADGAFLGGSMTCEDMQKKVEEILTGMRVPAFVIRKSRAAIPTLKRWRR